MSFCCFISHREQTSLLHFGIAAGLRLSTQSLITTVITNCGKQSIQVFFTCVTTTCFHFLEKQLFVFVQVVFQILTSTLFFTKIGLNTLTAHSKHKHLSLYAFQTRRAYWLCLKRDCSSLINVYLICNSNNDALQFYWKLDLSQTAIFPNFVLLAWSTPVQTFCAGIIILHSSISSGFLGHSLCAGLYKQFASLSECIQ